MTLGGSLTGVSDAQPSEVYTSRARQPHECLTETSCLSVPSTGECTIIYYTIMIQLNGALKCYLSFYSKCFYL